MFETRGSEAMCASANGVWASSTSSAPRTFELKRASERSQAISAASTRPHTSHGRLAATVRSPCTAGKLVDAEQRGPLRPPWHAQLPVGSGGVLDQLDRTLGLAARDERGRQVVLCMGEPR